METTVLVHAISSGSWEACEEECSGAEEKESSRVQTRVTRGHSTCTRVLYLSTQ